MCSVFRYFNTINCNRTRSADHLDSQGSRFISASRMICTRRHLFYSLKCIIFV